MDFSMAVTDSDAGKMEIVAQVQPDAAETAKLKEIADKNVAEIMSTDIESMDKKKTILTSIDQFGLDTLQSSAQKNSLLQISVGNLSKMGGESGDVSKGLVDLQREIKDLDPSLIDFTKTGVLGKIFNPIRAYFAKYQKADAVINDIIVSLDKGKTTLTNDNTSLEIEEQSLRDLTKQLMKEIDMATMMDDSISSQIEAAKAANTDPEKIKFISEEILFPLRQRIMDMQQMIVVNHQGIIAIEVVTRNNKELIRGVDRAKNVTISALKIATIVASALYNQKIVLKKIQVLNETTSDIISGTSKMLKEQGAEIQKQASESSVSVETLKTSFADVMAAMDAISTYKQQALPIMKDTIAQFKELAEKGEAEVQRLENGSKLSIS